MTVPLFYPPPYHLRRPGDDLDLELVRRLVTDRYDWYVSSHDDPRRRDEIDALLEAS